MNQSPPPPPFWVLLSVTAVLTLFALALIGTGLYLTGLWRRKQTATDNTTIEGLAPEPPLTFQFGLRAIFALTTGVAVYVMLDKWLGWHIGQALLSGICLLLSLGVPAGWMAVLLMMINGGLENARRTAGIMFIVSGTGVLLAAITFALRAS